MSATRGSSSADQSLPAVEFPPTAKVESAVGDVCGVHDMGLPTVNVESAVGDVGGPHDMPIVEVESAVGGGMCSLWKRTCTADDLRRVAARFGEDLARADLDALPRAWLSLPSARRVRLAREFRVRRLTSWRCTPGLRGGPAHAKLPSCARV